MDKPKKEYNVKDRGMPKGVYFIRGKYRASVWEEGGRLVWQKVFDTVDEAEYARKVHLHGHHWDNMPGDTSQYFGFIYRITDKETNKQYIGSKQFYRWAGPTGGYKCTDPTDEWWDPKAWAQNDWLLYTGSQDDLNSEIAFRGPQGYSYEVLELCQDKLSLHLAEIQWMIDENVLEAVDEKGNYLYYNKNIAGRIFRPPFKKADVVDAREETLEAMRRYYLKPELCTKCRKVIPYGGSKCEC